MGRTTIKVDAVEYWILHAKAMLAARTACFERDSHLKWKQWSNWVLAAAHVSKESRMLLERTLVTMRIGQVHLSILNNS